MTGPQHYAAAEHSDCREVGGCSQACPWNPYGPAKPEALTRMSRTVPRTGPEHYQEAQNLLELAVDVPEYDISHGLITQAQVHATLALAAATALYDADFDDGKDVEYQAWLGVAGTGEVTP